MLATDPSGECSTPFEIVDFVEVCDMSPLVVIPLPYEEDLPDGEVCGLFGGVRAEGFIKCVSQGSYLVYLRACSPEEELVLEDGPRTVCLSQGAMKATKVIIGSERIVPFHFFLVTGEEA